MPEEKGIWIITSEEMDTIEDSKSIGADYGDEEETKLKQAYVSAEDLNANLKEFLEVIEEAIDQADKPKPASKFQLDELELSVEVNGKGKLCLWGTGGELGGKGAIKLKFKRKDG